MQFTNFLAAAAVLASADAAALSSPSSPLVSRAVGKATFYGGNVSGGHCSYAGYTIQAGLYGVAAGGDLWQDSKGCGGCIEVTGAKGKIIVQVVDECPECATDHLDLFQNGFAKIDEINKGIIPIDYKWVNCPITSPIQIRNKEGTSPFWFSMQVINANKRVEKLEWSSDAGKTWIGTTRKPYNYFEYPAGTKTSAVDVRVTSINGDVVIVKNVPIGGSIKVTGASNFKLSSTSSVEEASEPVTAAPTEEPVAPVVEQPQPQPQPKPQAPAPAPAAPASTLSTSPSAAPLPPTVPAPAPEAAPVAQATAPVNAAKPQTPQKENVAIKANVDTPASTSHTTSHPTTTLVPVKVSTSSTPAAPSEKVVTVTITGCPAPTTLA